MPLPNEKMLPRLTTTINRRKIKKAESSNEKKDSSSSNDKKSKDSKNDKTTKNKSSDSKKNDKSEKNESDDSGSDESGDESGSGRAPIRGFDRLSFQQYKQIILADTFHHYYVTEDWSPAFYTELAYEGFIAVAQENYVLPEIQRSYCVLDFENLHVGKKVRKMLRRGVEVVVDGVGGGKDGDKGDGSGRKNEGGSGESDGNKGDEARWATKVNKTGVKNEVRDGGQTKTFSKYRLYINRDFDGCVEGICDYWGKKNWFSKKYADMVKNSGKPPAKGRLMGGAIPLKPHSVELYMVEEEGESQGEGGDGDQGAPQTAKQDKHVVEQGGAASSSKPTEQLEKDKNPTEPPERNPSAPTTEPNSNPTSTNSTTKIKSPKLRLIAGECGYTIGSIYTSLTGYCNKDINGCGTAQLVMLGLALKHGGYSFWNLGHPPSKTQMRYKADLGGVIFPRDKFLERWQEGREKELGKNVGKSVGKGLENGDGGPSVGKVGSGVASVEKAIGENVEVVGIGGSGQGLFEKHYWYEFDGSGGVVVKGGPEENDFQ